MAPLQHAAVKPHLRPVTLARAVDWSNFLKRPLFTPPGLECDAFFAEKTVLITGAGGSIGSVVAERLMGGMAGTLLLLDHSWPNLSALYRKFKQRHVTLPRVKFLPINILHGPVLQEVFSRYRPQIVFHAAALKHVAALESDPFTAIETNVLGTLLLLEAVQSSEVDCFVHVSTDKAVNPASVLGVSKRITELLLLSMQSDATRGISLRMGNVLGSSGSVVPLFFQALEGGLPLGITDRRASRYFLSLEEAAAFLMKSTEISRASLLLPEMGRSRKITELADFLLKEWNGEVCADPLRFTRLRDGEKLFERLTYDHEYLEDTTNPHVYRICSKTILDPDKFAGDLDRLLEVVADRRSTGLIQALSRIVPEFTPSPTLLRHVH
jgi:FlaA1/EpsC-like NDP-sugar epimerase